MLARLFIGIAKGVLVGALLGFGLALLGFAAPDWFIAYPAAALVGVLVGLIAGKPIWAPDARIEAGLKAGVGALLAAGIMFAVRRWLTMPVPAALSSLGGVGPMFEASAGVPGTLGGLAITSLAMIAAVLGGFYEVDNDPSEASPKSAAAGAKSQAGARGPRVAAEQDDAELDDEAEAEPDKKRAQK